MDEQLWKEASIEAMSETKAALDKRGITIDYLVRKLKKELNAHTVKAFAHEGQIKETLTLIDWKTRQTARMDAQKLLGLYPADRHELTGRDGSPLRFYDVPKEERDAILQANRLTREIINKNGNGNGASAHTEQ